MSETVQKTINFNYEPCHLTYMEDASQGRMLQQTNLHEITLEVGECKRAEEHKGKFLYTITEAGVDKGLKGQIMEDGTKHPGKFKNVTEFRGRFDCAHASIEWYDWYELNLRGVHSMHR